MRINILAACAIAAGSLAVSSCATIVEGTGQEIYMDVTPRAAVCNASQRGRDVARYSPEARAIYVPKSRRDLIIACSAPGYRDKVVNVVSEASAWGVVGALTIDLGIIDYSTGALNKYPANLTIVMERDDGSAPSEPPPVAEVPERRATAPRATSSAFPPATSSGTR